MASKGERNAERENNRVVATNRRARREFDLLDTFEAGMVLRGSEVKALRESKVQLAESYARIIANEVWLIGLHITTYSHAAGFGSPKLDRDRKLLLNRGEIDRIAARLEQEPLTLVPLSLYFLNGRAKLELAIARGRKTHDKRQAIARRDADMETQRAMAAARRR